MSHEVQLDRDFSFVRRLRSEGLLQEIKPDAFRGGENGSILITCGDRDRITDIFYHLREMAEIQTIGLNGGGILLGDNSFDSRRQIIIEDCYDAHVLKGSRLIKTLGHFPCGKARLCGFTVRDVVLMTLKGKRYIRTMLGNRIRDLHILPLIHIDWRCSDTPGKGCKTYFVQFAHYERMACIPY